jgi:hypothetical protein
MGDDDNIDVANYGNRVAWLDDNFDGNRVMYRNAKGKVTQLTEGSSKSNLRFNGKTLVWQGGVANPEIFIFPGGPTKLP